MIPKVRVTIPYIRAKKKKYLISKAKGKTKSNLEVFASGSVNIVNVTSLLFAIICHLFLKELVIAHNMLHWRQKYHMTSHHVSVII